MQNIYLKIKNNFMPKVERIHSGLTFLQVLTVLFIGLKLFDKIDWSWWWVVAPLWIPAVSFLALMIILLIIGVIIAFIGAIFDR